MEYAKDNVQIGILYKILTAEDVVKSINDNYHILKSIIPEISFMYGFEQTHPHHKLDVWNHTLEALSFSNNNFTERLSLLLHDIGKPFCYTEDPDGTRHFWGHPKASKLIAQDVLSRLKFPEEFAEKVCYLVLLHDDAITREEIVKNYDLERTRLNIQICDTKAHNPKYNQKRIDYINRTENLFNELKQGQEQ